MGKRYFIDMDGTLAKWNDVQFEELFEEGYYKNLEPNINVVNTVKRLLNHEQDVYILSAYLEESKYAKKEKIEWLQKYIPELNKDKYILLPYGEVKTNYIEGKIGKDDILLDDYTKNLLEWEKEGGFAIKLRNGINHNKGIWKGMTVSHNFINGNSFEDSIEVYKGFKEIAEKYDFKVSTDKNRVSLLACDISNEWREWIVYDLNGWIEILGNTDQMNIWFCDTHKDFTTETVVALVNDLNEKIFNKLDEYTKLDVKLKDFIDPEDWQVIANVQNAYEDSRYMQQNKSIEDDFEDIEV